MTTIPRVGYQRVNPSLANNLNSGRLKVAQERRCRLCLGSEQLSRHHLVPHAWFLQRKQHLKVLRNANANIVPLCRPCHAIVDGRDPVLKLQKRALLRRALYSNEVAFILQVRGQRWFNSHYPLNP